MHDDNGSGQFDRPKESDAIPLKTNTPRSLRIARGVFSALWFALLGLLLPGCQTAPPAAPTDSRPYITAVLREGDSIKIAFPGMSNQDTTQQVRRDGKITLSLGGERSSRPARRRRTSRRKSSNCSGINWR